MIEIVLRVKGGYYTYSEKTENRYVSYYNARVNGHHHVWPPGVKVNHNRVEFNYTYFANSLGLRSGELSRSDGDSCLIFFLGDSFTEGVGAPNDSTYPKIFGELLRNKHGVRVKVINAGVSGSDPFYCYKLFEDTLADFNPVSVILTVNSSDISDYIFRGGKERFLDDGTVRFRNGPRWEILYRYSHLFRWFIHSIMRYNDSLIRENQVEPTYKEAVAAITDVIIDLDSLCRQKGSTLITVIQPTPVEYGTGFYPFGDVRPIGLMLDTAGVANVVIHEMMGKKLSGGIEQYYWPIDRHFNSRGYAILSETVYQCIAEKYADYLNSLEQNCAAAESKNLL